MSIFNFFPSYKKIINENKELDNSIKELKKTVFYYEEKYTALLNSYNSLHVENSICKQNEENNNNKFAELSNLYKTGIIELELKSKEINDLKNEISILKEELDKTTKKKKKKSIK